MVTHNDLIVEIGIKPIVKGSEVEGIIRYKDRKAIGASRTADVREELETPFTKRQYNLDN